MTPDDMYLAARLSLLEMLKSGVTTVVQDHKVTWSLEHLEAAAGAGRAGYAPIARAHVGRSRRAL